MRATIEGLKNGKCAIHYNVRNVKALRKVLKKAFPDDKTIADGKEADYYCYDKRQREWLGYTKSELEREKIPSFPLQEFIDDMNKDTFVLPDSWCIKVTKNNSDILTEWKYKVSNGTFYEPANLYLYVKYNGAGIGNSIGFIEITFEQFKQYVLKESTKETTMTKKNRTLKPSEAQEIINAACSTWQCKLAPKWATYIVLKKDITVSESDYQEMRKVCTAEQHKLFDRIFGKDEEIYPDGTPCLIRDGSKNSWYLRYANGKGEFYINGQKSGNSISFEHHMKLDMKNLPVSQ